jgi:hypothetical protein
MTHINSLLLIITTCVALAAAPTVHATDVYQAGAISDITSTREGLLLKLNSGLPTNCTGTPWGWMIIPESNKTMVATALILWASGQRNVVVYTDGYTGNGYCAINQLDPA